MRAMTDRITIGAAQAFSIQALMARIGRASSTGAPGRVGGFLPEGMSRMSKGKDPR